MQNNIVLRYQFCFSFITHHALATAPCRVRYIHTLLLHLTTLNFKNPTQHDHMLPNIHKPKKKIKKKRKRKTHLSQNVSFSRLILYSQLKTQLPHHSPYQTTVQHWFCLWIFCCFRIPFSSIPSSRTRELHCLNKQ